MRIKDSEILYVDEDELRTIPVEMTQRGRAPGNLNYMAAYTLPVLNYLRTADKPHLVVGCDRGARLFTTAVVSMWHELFQRQPFPSLDGSVHFAHLAIHEQREGDDALGAARQTFKDMTLDARENLALTDRQSESERLHMLFIDDCMNKGRVRLLANELLDGLDAESHFAVMYGQVRDDEQDMRADVYGNGLAFKKMGTNGLSVPAEIGVDYKDGDFILVESDAALENYERLDRSVRKVSRIVRKK